MDPVSLPALSCVALCGGTHGNELSGVCLVREQQRKKEEETEHVTLVTVMSNPRAVQECRRYIEKDLNRCFTAAILSTPVSDGTPYEIVRAQELNALLGPKGSDGAMDLVCDLHNTTANMGLCLISNSECDWICMHIYKHLQTNISSIPVRLLNLYTSPDESSNLASVGKHGLLIEIGPQPHGLVRADVLSTMKKGVQLMLEWIRLFNSGTVFEGGEVEVHTVVKCIDFPRDPETHDITAVIHPQLQDQDFCLLRQGDPLFLSFSGETEVYRGEEPLYPVFVNESAYYEKGTALVLTRMKRVDIPQLRVKRD